MFLCSDLCLYCFHITVYVAQAFGVQTLSGTGSLRVAAEFLARHLKYSVFYYSRPSWGKGFSLQPEKLYLLIIKVMIYMNFFLIFKIQDLKSL